MQIVRISEMLNLENDNLVPLKEKEYLSRFTELRFSYLSSGISRHFVGLDLLTPLNVLLSWKYLENIYLLLRQNL